VLAGLLRICGRSRARKRAAFARPLPENLSVIKSSPGKSQLRLSHRFVDSVESRCSRIGTIRYSPIGTNRPLPRISLMERELDRRKQQALVAMYLSTATLIVCFSFALTLI
jgi:hypothetical protein